MDGAHTSDADGLWHYVLLAERAMRPFLGPFAFQPIEVKEYVPAHASIRAGRSWKSWYIKRG